MSVKIVRVDRSNFESVLPIIADYQRFFECEPDEECNREFFTPLLEDDTHGLQLAAVENDEYIGFATVYWVRSSTRAATVANLNDLFIRPDYRGSQGISACTGLMRKALEAARERGFTIGAGQTKTDNKIAQGVFEWSAKRLKLPTTRTAWVHYTHDLTEPTGPDPAE